MFKPLRRIIVVAFMAAAALSLITPASAQTPSGTIEFRVLKVGFIVGGGGGRGTLFYQGRRYPLSVGGVSIGATIGVASADMVGEVYNLNNPADIDGAYSAVSAGVAIAGGGKVASLSNARGVVIKVRGKQIGLKLSLDLSGLTIKLR